MSPHFTATIAELHRADLLADAQRHRRTHRVHPRRRGRTALALRAVVGIVTRA